MTAHILIVEDDEHINRIIADGLNAEGFRCTQAYSGTEGRLYAERGGYDLILLDLMLPGLSGEELIAGLKTGPHAGIPVIVLSAKERLDDKLDLFALGASDYVTKPFALEELTARIRVHLQRPASAAQAAPVYRHKKLTLGPESFTASVDGTAVHLTKREFHILLLLAKFPNRVFTKQDLYELAWEEPYLGEDKTVTVHVSNIRNKLRSCSDEEYIDTVWGIGFRLSP